MADSVREEIRAEDEPDLSSDDESIGSPEENWHLHACLTIERGLDPLYTPEDIQRIQEDAINADMPDTGAAVAASDAPILNVEPVRKRRYRDNMSSGVWVHFKKGVIQADGFYDATCLYCSKVYQMGNQKSTSSLRHHFEKGCRKVPSSKRHKPDALQRLLHTANSEGEANPAVWVFDQTRSRKSFAQAVMVHEYPFNIVSHHYFRVFLSEVQPQFKLISRNTLRADCIKIYEEEQVLLYQKLGMLDCKISFTSDLWTSNSRDRGFLALTCHFIDESWKLRKRIITFTPLSSPHTGQHIAQAIYEKLVLWNLDKKAFCLVLDNATSNDACIRDLLHTPLRETLPVDGSIFHQRCGCHILNLIVQDGLNVLSDEIHKIRETMKYIRHSQGRMERFRLAATQATAPSKKPAWDVPTRWNSTYLMLQLALELRQAINRFATLDKKFKFCPSESDWENVKALVECLKVFYDATLKLSGTKYPTINLFFPEFCEVFLVIKKMETSHLPFIVAMSKEMYAKWDKYWTSENMLLAIACVLDPRCKMTVVEYYFKELYPGDDCQSFIASLQACMNALFSEYLEAYSKMAQQQVGTSTDAGRASSSSRSSSGSISDIRARLKEVLRGKKIAEPVKSELEQYLEEALDDANLEEEFDILSWWKLKSTKYPILSRLTRDILAVPISTVASESTFSTSGRTLSPVRNSLNDESIEALICGQDWLRAPVTEIGGQVGDPMWSGDQAVPDDTICG